MAAWKANIVPRDLGYRLSSAVVGAVIGLVQTGIIHASMNQRSRGEEALDHMRNKLERHRPILLLLHLMAQPPTKNPGLYQLLGSDTTLPLGLREEGRWQRNAI